MSSLQIVIDENNPDENWNDVYLLLTEFEISTINYDLSFFRLDQCTERVMDRENEVIKSRSEWRPAKLTNHGARTNWEIGWYNMYT